MRNTIIIGSGISGLFVLKHLKENNHHDVLILDKNPNPFGVWNKENHPSVLPFTYTVSSKLYMTISDFPMPKHYPEFPHHSDILKYYLSYAKKFDLIKHIKNNVEVLKIEKDADADADVWHLHTEKHTYSCKNLVIACGTVNNSPNIPTDSVFAKFKGTKFHADDFKIHSSALKDKRILIIGVSDTSCDLAEVFKKQNSVTMSSNRGVWFQNRNWGAYAPADMFYNRFIDFIIKKITGKKAFDYIVGRNWVMGVGLWWGENGHGIKEWRTNSGYLNSYYVKSRDIISSISKGEIKAVDGIKEIHDNGKSITFKNGITEDFDTIIFCTGYAPFGGLKFLDKKYYKHLYKHIFSCEDPSLSFAGYVRPYLTSIPMLSEMQSRWIAQEICNKNQTLPTSEAMIEEAKRDKDRQIREFPHNYKRLGTIVDPYDYCNMIASKINAIPSWWTLFNLKLITCIYLSSWNHHYFRLNDANSEKRDIAIRNINSIAHENPTSLSIRGISSIIIISVIVILLLIVKSIVDTCK